jgi:hypothetical protein
MSALPIGSYGRFGLGGSDVSIYPNRTLVCSSPVFVVSDYALRRNWRGECQAQRGCRLAKRGRAFVPNELLPVPYAADEHFTQNDRNNPYAYANACPSFPQRRAGSLKIHGALACCGKTLIFEGYGLHRLGKKAAPGRKAIPQGLKPDVFSIIYGPTKVVP